MAVTGVREQDPVAGLKRSGGCEKGTDSGWTYGEGRDLGSERKWKGSKDNSGFRDPPAYPFLNTGTLYSEIQPSSGTLARVHLTQQPQA